MKNYDDGFFERHTHVLSAINAAVVEERSSSPWLVDIDVIEAYKALGATMRTLSSGIYYESLPEGPVRLSLFRRLKGTFDELMTPETAGNQPILKASEAVAVLDFMGLIAQLHSSVRPRSRRYLDWISETFGYSQPQQSGGLILP